MADRKSTISIDLAGSLWDKGRDGIELMKTLADNIDRVSQMSGKSAKSTDLLAAASKGVAQSKADVTLKQMMEYMERGASFGEAYSRALKDVSQSLNQAGQQGAQNFQNLSKEASLFSRVATQVSFGANQLAAILGQSASGGMKLFAEGLRGIGGILQSIPLGPVGIAVSILTTAFTLFAQVQKMTASETQKNAEALRGLKDQLDKQKDPGAADALAKLLGISKSTAQAYIEMASRSREFAQTLDEQIQKVEEANQRVSGITESQRIWDQALSNIEVGLKSFGMLAEAVFKKLADGFNEFVRIFQAGVAGLSTFFQALQQGKSLADANTASIQASADAYQRSATVMADTSVATSALASAQNNLSNAFDQAGNSGERLWSVLQRLSQAESQMTSAIAQVDAQLAEQSSQLSNQAAEAAASANEAIINAQQNLADTIGNIEEGLASNIASINQSLGAQLENLAFQRYMQEKQFAHDMLVEQQKYQEQLRKLTIETAMQIAKLDFDTHEQLQKAKTAREQDDIRRKALFERGQINQQMAEKRAQIDFEHRMAVQELSFKDHMNELQYQHQVQMAQKAAGAQKAAAAAAAEAQIEKAKEAEAKQEESIKKNLDKQLASIARQSTAYQKQHDERVKQATQLFEDTKKHIQDETELAKAKLNEIPKWVSIDVVLNLDQVQTFIDLLKAGKDPSKFMNMGQHGGVGAQNNGAGGYQFGGQIPGPIGAPRVAIVHGGEEVKPVSNIQTKQSVGSVSISLGQNTWADPIVRQLIQDLRDKRVIERTVDMYLDNEKLR